MIRTRAIRMRLPGLIFRPCQRRGYVQFVLLAKPSFVRSDQAITFSIFPSFIIETFPPLSDTTNPTASVTLVRAATEE